jgi:DNA-binding transcriptional LysR family regulator
MPLFPVGSVEMVHQCGLHTYESVPTDVTLLVEDREQDLWAEWAGRSLSNPTRQISDANVRVQAAIDGQGLILADALMQTELDSGVLVAPFKHELGGYGYVISCSSASRLGDDAQSLCDWLRTD